VALTRAAQPDRPSFGTRRDEVLTNLLDRGRASHQSLAADRTAPGADPLAHARGRHQMSNRSNTTLGIARSPSMIAHQMPGTYTPRRPREAQARMPRAARSAGMRSGSRSRPRLIGVSTGPGFAVTTRTPAMATRLRTASRNAFSPALEAW